MIIKHGRHIYWEVHEVCKGLWAFFLDCALRWLAGQANSSHTDSWQCHGMEDWARFRVNFDFCSLCPEIKIFQKYCKFSLSLPGVISHDFLFQSLTRDISYSMESWLNHQFSLHHSYICSWMVRRICIMSLGVKGLNCMVDSPVLTFPVLTCRPLLCMDSLSYP